MRAIGFACNDASSAVVALVSLLSRLDEEKVATIDEDAEIGPRRGKESIHSIQRRGQTRSETW
jgi:hypothetical protein